MLKLIRDYLKLGSLSMVAAVVGIAGTAYTAYNQHRSGGSSGGNSGAPGAMTYVPEWQGGADQMWQQIMQHWGDTANGDAAHLTDYLHGAESDAEAAIPGLQGRMNNYGSALESLGTRFANRESGLTDAGASVWDLARDPENALHNRLQQGVVDQNRAATSARGIGMGAESAGLENQAVSDFNMNWQDRLLGRAESGARSMAGAYNEAGRQGQGLEGALTGATNFYRGSYELPFNLASMYGGAMGTSVYNPWNALQANLGSYMGLGQSGSSAAFGQGQTNLNNITSGLQSLSQQPWLQNLFSNYGSGPDSGGSGASSTVDNTTWGGA